MLLAVAGCFALAVISPGLYRIFGKRSGPLMALLPASVFLFLLSKLPSLTESSSEGPSALLESYTWVQQWDIGLSFRLDGLSLLFSLMITGIGALVFAYSGSYMAKHGSSGRFYPLLAAFMGAMLGLVLADDLIAMFVFWELTSITSYLLIGFDYDKLQSRKSALQALLVTGAGGLALLAGFILLIQASDARTFTELLSGSLNLTSHSLYPGILILIALGAFTKSAQWPFHFWLPSAMVAPAPVSTYLHSATMVKAGVYLLARLQPVLSGTPFWENLFVVAGLMTLLTGAVMTLWQSDLKSLLAYSTVAALGTMVLLIGIGGKYAAVALGVYIAAHALYKAALFLISGIIDMQTGTRDINKLGGLFKKLPVTGTAALLAGLSFAGLPPVTGYIAKELLYKSTWSAPYGLVLSLLVVTAKAILFYTAYQVAIKPFFGKMLTEPKSDRKAPMFMVLGPILLAVSGFLLGVFGTGATGFFESVGSAVANARVTADLSLWHGLIPAFWLSVVTVLLGFALMSLKRFILRSRNPFDTLGRFGPTAIYNAWLEGTIWLGHWQTALIQNGRLRIYILIVLSVILVLGGGTYLLNLEASSIQLKWDGIRFYELLIAIITLSGALGTVLSKGRLTAIVTLGVAGLGVALIFMFFGGPDLSVTQISVETLSVLLLVVALYSLPKFRRLNSTGTRARDVTVAVLTGMFLSVLTLDSFTGNRVSELGRWFAEQSYLAGKGRNVVNVILVDFRAMDTLGEITVVAIAAIGVLSLLRVRSGRDGTAPQNLPELPVCEDKEASR